MAQSQAFSDPVAAALARAMPILAQPHQGASIDIDEFVASRDRNALLVGSNGLFMGVTRPWLCAILPIVTSAVPAPYGAVAPRLTLRCGRIPANLVDQARQMFVDALPNEAAAFAIWNEATREFRLERAGELSATPSRIEYLLPDLGDGDFIVADMHSHGAAPAFWSQTDDADDRNHTRICAVFGSLDPENTGSFTAKSRICANGLTLDIPELPILQEPVLR
ncbi:MAG: PRTRC system protein A [Sphingomonadaceae bacterium]